MGAVKVCAVNVAYGAWYPAGQIRLRESLREYAPRVIPHFFNGTYPPGSPTHQEVPYGFKPAAILDAIRIHDPDVAIWMDASMWCIRGLEGVVGAVEAGGVAAWQTGFTVGQWCTDAALPLLGVTRDEAFTLPLVAGGFVGFDLRSDVGPRVLRNWSELAQRGAFNGPWQNKVGEASVDGRVSGHRHDMPALSVLLHREGIAPHQYGDLFAYWSENPGPRVAVVARGM